jgi:hypothetical protein
MKTVEINSHETIIEICAQMEAEWPSIRLEMIGLGVPLAQIARLDARMAERSQARNQAPGTLAKLSPWNDEPREGL